MAGVKRKSERLSQEDVITVSSSDDEEVTDPVRNQPTKEEMRELFRDDSSNTKFHGNPDVLLQRNECPLTAERERPTSASKSDELIQKFVSVLLGSVDSATEKEIVQRILKIKQNCKTKFLNSKDFEDLINSALEKIRNDRRNIFVYIKEVYDEMKCYYIPKNSKNIDRDEAETNPEILKENDEPSRLEKNEKDIRKLENLMKKLDKKIRHLKRKEISLDEMDDACSAYIYEDKLAKRLMKVWKKLCELKKRSPSLRNNVDKKIRYQASRFPEINERVEKFLNSTKAFPDYTDILRIAKSVNEDSSLGLSDASVKYLAQEVFEDVGQKLQRRRLKDHQELFGCYLTDDMEGQSDPSETDQNLKAILDESYADGQRNFNKLLSEYSEMQVNLKLEPEEVPDEAEGDLEAEEHVDDDEEDREIEMEQMEDEIDSDVEKLDNCLSDPSLIDLEDDDDDDTKSQSSSVSNASTDVKMKTISLENQEVLTNNKDKTYFYQIQEESEDVQFLSLPKVDSSSVASTSSNTIFRIPEENEEIGDEINPPRSCLARLKLTQTPKSAVPFGGGSPLQSNLKEFTRNTSCPPSAKRTRLDGKTSPSNGNTTEFYREVITILD